MRGLYEKPLKLGPRFYKFVDKIEAKHITVSARHNRRTLRFALISPK